MDPLPPALLPHAEGPDARGVARVALPVPPAAAAALVDLVRAGGRLTLYTDDCPEGEGCAEVWAQDGGLRAQRGGHGWQGPVQALTVDQAVALIDDLAPHNGGAPPALVRLPDR